MSALFRASRARDAKLSLHSVFLSSACRPSLFRRPLSTSSPRFHQNLQPIKVGGIFYQDFQFFHISASPPHDVETLCMVDNVVYYHLIGTFPNFPEPMPPSGGEKCYSIQPVLNRGLGLIATRNIEPGEIIVSERPVLVLPVNIPFPRFRSRPITMLWNRLSEKQVGILEALFNCNPPPSSSKSSMTDFRKGIINTNALGLQFFSAPELDNPYAGIFPEISRCNHSCTPNALCNFDLPHLAVHLTANKSIAQGDEITIAYIEPLYPRTFRRTGFAAYHFFCTCPSCNLPKDKSLRSDALRTLIHDWADPTVDIDGWEAHYDNGIRHIISNYGSKDSRIKAASISLKSPSTTLTDLHSVIHSGKQYYELCRSEDVHTDYIYHALERVAFAYALLGEEDQFKDWGRRARIELRVLGSIAVGKSIFTDEQWGKALSSPTGFIDSWGMKKVPK